jgi:hypothetical protein
MQKKLLITAFIVAVLSLVLGACSNVPKSDSSATDQKQLTSAANGDSTAAPFSGANNEDNSDSTEHKGFFSRSPAIEETITLPVGTVVNVRLQRAVSSATASPGQTFDAVLDEPLVVKDQTVAPRGAAVTGRVVEAKSSGRLHDSGYLRLTLATITVNGKALPIETSSLFAKGANHNKRNAALIGGGAGAGALIGGLAGGGKGALIGGLVGAGAGTGGAYATGQKDVAFGAERRLSFRLTQPLVTKA